MCAGSTGSDRMSTPKVASAMAASATAVGGLRIVVPGPVRTDPAQVEGPVDRAGAHVGTGQPHAGEEKRRARRATETRILKSEVDMIVLKATQDKVLAVLQSVSTTASSACCASTWDARNWWPTSVLPRPASAR